MKTSSSFSAASLVLLLLASSLTTAMGQIQVRLSVKFIRNWDGTRPSGDSNRGADISTTARFDGEITRGNRILSDTWRGYRLVVVEYFDIQPSAPPLFSPDYWFNLNARENRSTIESAAIVDPAWRWNPDAINIYVNNSSFSGQCSFVGTGGAISLAATVGTGTVLHEVGHIFDLRHTHPGDPDCQTFNPTPPLSQYLGDGDGLDATILDYSCFDLDQLSKANFGADYSVLSDAQKEAVNTSWLNVMSYHQEDRLLDFQMDTWASRANFPRRGFCSGRTWFVDPRGICAIRLGGVSCNGIDGGPYNSVTEAVNSANPNGGDIVMIRPSSYNERFTRLNKPVTLRATREGPATIGR